MLCEKCGKNLVDVAVQEMVNGEQRRLYVCKECMTEPLERKLVEMVGMLFGLPEHLHTPDADGAEFELRCKECGITRSTFRKGERLGCAACYETFKRDLEVIVAEMHRGRAHAGKLPGSERAALVRARLEGELRAAVAAQRFEEAARLRDRLKELAAELQGEKERHAAS